jgi:hypothetical protein
MHRKGMPYVCVLNMKKNTIMYPMLATTHCVFKQKTKVRVQEQTLQVHTAIIVGDFISIQPFQA